MNETPQAPTALSGLELPDHYFAATEVDTRAEPKELAALIYPGAAFNSKTPGRVKVRLFLNESGHIDSIDIIDATPPGLFETAALDAVLQSSFTPAYLLGRPVKSIKIIEIIFDPFQDQPR